MFSSPIFNGEQHAVSSDSSSSLSSHNNARKPPVTPPSTAPEASVWSGREVLSLQNMMLSTLNGVHYYHQHDIVQVSVWLMRLVDLLDPRTLSSAPKLLTLIVDFGIKPVDIWVIGYFRQWCKLIFSSGIGRLIPTIAKCIIMLIMHDPAKEHDFGPEKKPKLQLQKKARKNFMDTDDRFKARKVQHEEKGKGKIEKRRRRQLTLRGTSRHRPEQSCGMCCHERSDIVHVQVPTKGLGKTSYKQADYIEMTFLVWDYYIIYVYSDRSLLWSRGPLDPNQVELVPPTHQDRKCRLSATHSTALRPLRMKVSVYKSSSTSRRLTTQPANTDAPFPPPLTNVGPPVDYFDIATAINGIVMLPRISYLPPLLWHDSSHSNNQFGSKYLVSGASDVIQMVQPQIPSILRLFDKILDRNIVCRSGALVLPTSSAPSQVGTQRSTLVPNEKSIQRSGKEGSMLRIFTDERWIIRGQNFSELSVENVVLEKVSLSKPSMCPSVLPGVDAGVKPVNDVVNKVNSK
ncbi:hypothetical protein JOM56_015617 [Amanita muscaria]